MHWHRTPFRLPWNAAGIEPTTFGSAADHRSRRYVTATDFFSQVCPKHSSTIDGVTKTKLDVRITTHSGVMWRYVVNFSPSNPATLDVMMDSWYISSLIHAYIFCINLVVLCTFDLLCILLCVSASFKKIRKQLLSSALYDTFRMPFQQICLISAYRFTEYTWVCSSRFTFYSNGQYKEFRKSSRSISVGWVGQFLNRRLVWLAHKTFARCQKLRLCGWHYPPNPARLLWYENPRNCV